MRLALVALLAAGALSACSLPQPKSEVAGRYLAKNQLWVTSTGPGTFRVEPGPGTDDGPGSYWCAAGEFAQVMLNQGATTQMYRTSPPPRHTGQGMDFSLSPENAQKSGIVRFGNSGPGFSVGEATGSFCPIMPVVAFGGD
ncbi:hypothetical protein [Acidimangrovimonas sediminis]|uniref:hypothetical protein n=1 Tax=Acidimangrovimonas sediminis TaxID=2056283 RepID=UPI000C8049E6|nr:hypothetical protein [Acidimangrovimonas sediminis]